MISKIEILVRYSKRKDSYLFKCITNDNGEINLIDFGISNEIGMEAKTYSKYNKQKRVNLLQANKYSYSKNLTYENQDVIKSLNSYANDGDGKSISQGIARLITILAGANCTKHEGEKLKVYVDRVGKIIKLSELDKFLN